MDVFSLAGALKQKILPAITFDSVESALPVAEALLKAGLTVMEIPFRTAVAEQAISVIRKVFPEMKVGAGTLLTLLQLKSAIDCGAQFGISPGFNQTICNEAKQSGFPFIPGVMTPSEMEAANGLDHKILKLFPAGQIGAMNFLKAMEGPYEHLKIKFIPMGGVSLQNIESYLRLSNVIAVGGSWLATKELMATKNYKAIEENVSAALMKIKHAKDNL